MPVGHVEPRFLPPAGQAASLRDDAIVDAYYVMLGAALLELQISAR
ncbi:MULTISPECIES: hypothetical protein [Amycolatopsis]|uniref:Uncharacterized protein n=1 Tax=Amycolatopsis thermalba TaxID=944492 RepID=A0ABY4NXP1_9PSEU|nr:MULTISPECIES: hypothetical protein [Amycolatopsis]UQS24763.1 hypothetical protein L1857_19015 [Amycolatopsis thermalba]